MLPQFFTVERIFCCFPLTVGAFIIALGELTVSCMRIAFVYLNPHTCAAFEDKYLLYTCLVNVRYFCDELGEERETKMAEVFVFQCFLFLPRQPKPTSPSSCSSSS